VYGCAESVCGFPAVSWNSAVGAATQPERITYIFYHSNNSTSPATDKSTDRSCYCYIVAEFEHPITPAGSEKQAAERQTFDCTE
jgi:hypothetical protein